MCDYQVVNVPSPHTGITKGNHWREGVRFSVQSVSDSDKSVWLCVATD